MAEAVNTNILTRDVLVEVLTATFTAHEARLLQNVGALIDQKILASEARQQKLLDRRIQASEDRMLNAVGEAFQSMITYFDQRFDHIERRLDKHAIQIDRLQQNA